MVTPRFFVIGSSHSREAAALAAVSTALDTISPDQLILEMPEDAPKTGALVWQSPEIVLAFNWAQKRGVPTCGYEPKGHSILRDGLTTDRINELVEEIRRLGSELTPQRGIELYSKNSPPRSATEERLKVLDAELIDPQKAMARTKAIVDVIRTMAQDAGTVLIIGGSNHTPYIAASLPGCEIVRGEHFY